MKKIKVLTLVLLLAFALTLAACGNSSIGIIGGADGPTKIFVADSIDSDDLIPVTLVLDWTPNINHSGAYVAQELGFFLEQGLDVTIIEPGDNLALQLVAAGQAEFGFSYQEEVTYARVAGAPVVSLAAVIQHNTSCFAAPKAKGVATVADFAGKTYGGWGGEVEEALLQYLLEREGLSQPVRTVNLGSADFFAATEGEVDFSWIFYGVTGVEAELRGVELDTIYLRDIDPAFDYYTPVIVAAEDFLAENDDLTRRFMTALSRGYQFCDQEPEQAADLLLQSVPGLDQEMIRAGQNWLAGQYQGDADYWGWQDQAVWSGFAAWLTERGLIEGGFGAKEAFTNAYLPTDQ